MDAWKQLVTRLRNKGIVKRMASLNFRSTRKSSRHSSQHAISLPPEILVKVFAYLDVCSRGTAAQVCRTWSQIADVPILWRDVEIRRLSSASLYDVYIRRGMRRMKLSTMLLDCRSSKTWARQVNDFISYRNNRTAEGEGEVEISLDLRILCTSTLNESLVSNMEAMSRLVRSLRVGYLDMYSLDFITAFVTEDRSINLVELYIAIDSWKISASGAIYGHQFWNTLRKPKQLRRLGLHHAHYGGLNDEAFLCLADGRNEVASWSADGRPIAAEPLPLTMLHLSVANISIKSFEYISQSLCDLVELCVFNGALMTLDELTCLSECKNLRRLTVRYFEFLDVESGQDDIDRIYGDQYKVMDDDNCDCYHHLEKPFSKLAGSFGHLDMLIVFRELANYHTDPLLGREIMGQFKGTGLGRLRPFGLAANHDADRSLLCPDNYRICDSGCFYDVFGCCHEPLSVTWCCRITEKPTIADIANCLRCLDVVLGSCCAFGDRL